MARKYTNWMSVQWLLDHWEREGLLFLNEDGYARTPRQVLERFISFSLGAGVELNENDDFEPFIRFERSEIPRQEMHA